MSPTDQAAKIADEAHRELAETTARYDELHENVYDILDGGYLDADDDRHARAEIERLLVALADAGTVGAMASEEVCLIEPRQMEAWDSAHAGDDSDQPWAWRGDVPSFAIAPYADAYLLVEASPDGYGVREWLVRQMRPGGALVVRATRHKLLRFALAASCLRSVTDAVHRDAILALEAEILDHALAYTPPDPTEET